MKKVVDDVYVVKPFDPNAVDCCVYLVDTKSEDGLILVDAGITFKPFEEIEKEGFKLADIKHCLITHGHLDHYGVCYRLKEFYKDIKFYAHELDAERIEQKQTEPFPNQFYANYKYEPVKVTHRITRDNEILKFGQLEVKCLHIPGHTPGSLAYILSISGKNINKIEAFINMGKRKKYIPGYQSMNHHDPTEQQIVDAAVKRVEAAGGKMAAQPKTIDLTSQPPISMRIAFIKGPDGEEIEFFQQL